MTYTLSITSGGQLAHDHSCWGSPRLSLGKIKSDLFKFDMLNLVTMLDI